MTYDDSFSSPPYPGETTKIVTLYKYLEILRAWIVEAQDDLRDAIPAAPASTLTDPPELGGEEAWQAMGVVDYFAIFIFLRHIRETWDRILREFEDAWESQACLLRRYTLVMNARAVLVEAFIGPEAREARRHHLVKLLEKQQYELDEHFKRTLFQTNQKTLSDEDYNAWWDPSDADKPVDDGPGPAEGPPGDA